MANNKWVKWCVGLSGAALFAGFVGFISHENPAAASTGGQAGGAISNGAVGRARHHLIDPAALLPAESDIVQATVVAPRLTQAEAYAKCLIVLGTAGIPWLEARRPELGYVLIGRDGSVRRGGALERYAPGGEPHARAT